MAPMVSEQMFFDVLSDQTRRRILRLIMGEGELCVCELFYALDMPQPKVSRHLAVMREAGVLSVRKDGTWVFYRVAPQLPAWAGKVLEALTQGTAGAAPYRQDEEKLSGMANRPVRCCA